MLEKASLPSTCIAITDGAGFLGIFPVKTNSSASIGSVGKLSFENKPYQVSVYSCFAPHKNA